MAQRQGSTAVADAPDTLPADFFDKKQQGAAPDTLPADFFDKRTTGEEPSEEELPGSTPKLRAAVASGMGRMKPVTQTEKQAPQIKENYGFTPGNVLGNVYEGAKGVIGSAAQGLYDTTLGEGKDEQGEERHGIGGLFGFNAKGEFAPIQRLKWLGQKYITDPASGEFAKGEEELKQGHILPAIGHDTAGLIPMIGPWAASLGEQAATGDVGGTAGQIGGAMLGGKIISNPKATGRAIGAMKTGVTDALADRFSTPAIASLKDPQAIANLQQPLARRGIEKTLSATSMPAGQHNLRNAFTLAAPDLAEIERTAPLGKAGKAGGFVNPDLRIRETVTNIDKHLDKLWNEERQPQIERNGELPALTREELLGDATPEQIGRMEKSFKMAIPQEINLATADKLLAKVNMRLRGAEGSTPEGRAMALELSPDLQKFNEMKGVLHENIGGLLERVGEPGIKEFNKRYGVLSEVRDALRNRMNPEESVRALDALRATGGIGRNVNLFERLHLKASPGRNLQKGLEDLARTNLQINPPAQRPPIAGMLPPPATPAGGPVDMGGPVRGGRWTTAKALLEGPEPIQGEYIPPTTPAPRTIPPIRPYVDPFRVEDPFRIQAPRMQSGTIPPIEPVTSSTILPGGGGVREMRLLPGGGEAAPAPEAPKPPIKLEPLKAVPKEEPKPEPGAAAEPEPEEVKIKGLTAEEPKATGSKKIKPIPVEKRYSMSQILDAEGLLASESGAMLSADKPGAYFDEIGQGDRPNLKENFKTGTRHGGQWRGVTSGRDMYPFMRENPDLNPSAVQKALRNKDSAAYSKLMDKAVDFIKREESRGAEDFLKQMENPDAEPENVAPGADEFAPPEEPEAPKPAAPIIPPIEIAQKGGILPGMEQHVAEQNAGAAKVAAENLTNELNTPKGDITQAAGRMENLSPLFRGTEASPQREIFGKAPNAPAPASTTPPVIDAALKDSGWKFEGKNNLGQYVIKEPGTNIKQAFFERELNEDFIRRKMAEKEKQFGVPQERKPEVQGGEAPPSEPASEKRVDKSWWDNLTPGRKAAEQELAQRRNQRIVPYSKK